MLFSCQLLGLGVEAAVFRWLRGRMPKLRTALTADAITELGRAESDHVSLCALESEGAAAANPGESPRVQGGIRCMLTGWCSSVALEPFLRGSGVNATLVCTSYEEFALTSLRVLQQREAVGSDALDPFLEEQAERLAAGFVWTERQRQVVGGNDIGDEDNTGTGGNGHEGGGGDSGIGGGDARGSTNGQSDYGGSGGDSSDGAEGSGGGSGVGGSGSDGSADGGSDGGGGGGNGEHHRLKTLPLLAQLQSDKSAPDRWDVVVWDMEIDVLCPVVRAETYRGGTGSSGSQTHPQVWLPLDLHHVTCECSCALVCEWDSFLAAHGAQRRVERQDLRGARLQTGREISEQMVSLRRMVPQRTRLIFLGVADPYALDASYLSPGWRRTVRALPASLRRGLSAHVGCINEAVADAVCSLPNTTLVSPGVLLGDADLQEWTHLSRRGMASIAEAIAHACASTGEQGEECSEATVQTGWLGSVDSDGDIELERLPPPEHASCSSRVDGGGGSESERQATKRRRST